MNSNQEARLNMYHAVISHSDANNAVVTTVPAFEAALTSFKAKVSSIESTTQLEAQVISGLATDKNNLRTTLAQQATDIAAVVFAYAASINNNTLKAQVNFSRTDLLRLKDDELAPNCRNIHDAANSNLAALASYGITAPMLSTFDTLISDYAAHVPSPRNAAALRKTYAATLKALFKESNDILKNQMDKVAVQFKAAYGSFYITYRNNRIILDAATSSTKAAGAITDSVSGKGLDSVTITVEGQSYTVISESKGSYEIKIPATGIYTLIFTRSGYETLQAPGIGINLGQTTTLNVQLVKL